MRKITKESALALKNEITFVRDNTVVTNSGMMFLHGNNIANYCDGELSIYDCGWQTNTTKERLNGVLYYFNLGHIFQKDWSWFYMDKDRNITPFNGSMSFDV